AREAVVVCAERSSRRYRDAGAAYRVIVRPALRLKDWVRALRPQQWAKNSLLALPLIASHRVLEVDLWLSLLIAVIAFSLTASFAYVVNDLLDLQQDRRHHTKRN